MTQPPTSPPPGWYANSRGQRQWWDGRAWGPLSDTGGPPAVQYVNVPPIKSVGATYALALLLGGAGAHRFHLRKFGTAWVYLIASVASVLFRLDGHPTSITIANILLVAVWVWIIVDLFRIPAMVRELNASTYARAQGLRP